MVNPKKWFDPEVFEIVVFVGDTRNKVVDKIGMFMEMEVLKMDTKATCKFYIEISKAGKTQIFWNFVRIGVQWVFNIEVAIKFTPVPSGAPFESQIEKVFALYLFLCSF